VLCGIAWKQAEGTGEALLEARFEPIAQFLPTFVVIVLILWLRAGAGAEPRR
jgi:hypothetical protein